MVCGLASYLVKNGVHRKSIAIITPYKGQLMLIRKLLISSKLITKSQNPPFKPDPAHSCVLSTVDRFQGDEADIVIISLVIDGGKHASQFVNLQNRMIVTLSRARLGMYIISNINFFEKHAVPHWQEVLAMLKKPAENDSKIQELVVYDKSRIGPNLPICCPAHRDNIKPAKNENDLSTFCKVTCQEPLKCTHECGLPCHLSRPHNTNCKALVPSPCPHHPKELKCSNIFPNDFKGTLADAISRYQCDTRVKTDLPCGHVQTFPCAERALYVNETRPWPKCQQPASSPFIHPTCGHQIQLECHVYHRCTIHPELAPQCDEKVTYTPPCGHSVTIPCYLKLQYEKNKNFICKMQVELNLPRCGHFKKVPCPEATRLSSYQGNKAQNGEVREGEAYGPMDSICTRQINFIRTCGHVEVKSCNEAFDLAKSNSRCLVEEKFCNPICGHDTSVKCYQKKPFEEQGIKRVLPPITTIEESDPNKLYMHVPSVIHLCHTNVQVKRICGHVINVPCQSARYPLGPCKGNVVVSNPQCNHKLSVPCALVSSNEFKSWKPWSDNFLQSNEGKLLMNQNILCEGGDIPTAPQFDIPKCTTKTAFRRKCGHVITIPCCDAFLKLKLPAELCQQEVEIEQKCGHGTIKLKCHLTEKYQSDTSMNFCTEIVSKKCWNFGICSQMVDCRCNSLTAECNHKSTWICSKGHAFNIAQCSRGLPSTCPKCNISATKECLDKIGDKLENLDASNLSLKKVSELIELDIQDIPFQSLRKARLLQRGDIDAQTIRRIFISQIDAIDNYFQIAKNQDPFDRFLFAPKFVPIFFIQSKNNPNPFLLSKKKTPFGQGHLMHQFSKRSLELVQGQINDNTIMHVGYGYVVNPVIFDNESKAKDLKMVKFLEVGHDCALIPGEKIVFWFPAIFLTHKIVINRAIHSELIKELQTFDLKLIRPLPQKIDFRKEDFKKIESLTKSLNSNNSNKLAVENRNLNVNARDQNSSLISPPSFKGTTAENICVISNWDGSSLGIFLDPHIQSELEKKLKCAYRIFNHPPPKQLFGGQEFISHLLSNNEKTIKPESITDLNLLLCLEKIELKYYDEAIEALSNYFKGLKKSNYPAHALLFLALGRLSIYSKNIPNAQLYFHDFRQLYPVVAEKWLTSEDISIFESSSLSNSSSLSSKKKSALEEWEDLKAKDGCSSKAMENLLKLTGLKKVKEFSIKLFKQALALSKMTPEDRKLNQSFALNFSFMGNPGTGKTTVARLFAEILHDSGARKKNTFFEISAQKLKDEGPDKFRQLVDQATDGVLFIDEAYDLDPSGDFKGKPIVSELVTIAENKRDKISIILAGYQDDMNKKLFSFNEGIDN